MISASSGQLQTIASRTRMSVLLVDDNPFFLNTLKIFVDEKLREIVQVVDTANSGTEAIRKANALRPQVVLMDVSMADMSGLEVTMSLKRDLPQTHIILFSLMQDLVGYRQAATAAGADNLIQKDNLYNDLLPAIQQLKELDRLKK